MKICRYDDDRLGIVLGDKVHDVTAAQTEIRASMPYAAKADPVVASLPAWRERLEKMAAAAPGKPVAQVKLLSPVARPPKILAAPTNYSKHVEEMQKFRDTVPGLARFSPDIEKAGIFRAQRTAVIGETDPPTSLLTESARIGAWPLRLGMDYRVEVEADDWRWIGAGTSLRLPHPGLRAPVQHYNAAAAIAALMALRDRLSVPFRALRVGLLEAHVHGRLEIFPGEVETVVDVGHNPQAARVLADWLRQHPRRTRAVFAALAVLVFTILCA